MHWRARSYLVSAQDKSCKFTPAGFSHDTDPDGTCHQYNAAVVSSYTGAHSTLVGSGISRPLGGSHDVSFVLGQHQYGTPLAGSSVLIQVLAASGMGLPAPGRVWLAAPARWRSNSSVLSRPRAALWVGWAGKPWPLVMSSD